MRALSQSAVSKSDAGSESVERGTVSKSTVVPQSAFLYRVPPPGLHEVPTCFPFWAPNYEKRLTRRCLKECKICTDNNCLEDHPPTTQCPPCLNHINVQLVGCDGLYTTKGGPIEISLASKKQRIYNVIPWTFRLHGMACNLLISVEFRTPKESIDTLGNFWTWKCLQFIAWDFEKYGFSDKAIVEVYNRLHEITWDALMQSSNAHLTDERTVEMLSPAYKVVIVATWNGQLKVAGDCMDKLSVLGDVLGDEFEDETSYELTLYGEPSGATVTIRKKAACEGDVFMMVSKRIGRSKLTSIAKDHDDVEQMAKSLLSFDKKLKAAWVAKMHNPSGQDDVVELSSLTRFEREPLDKVNK